MIDVVLGGFLVWFGTYSWFAGLAGFGFLGWTVTGAIGFGTSHPVALAFDFDHFRVG